MAVYIYDEENPHPGKFYGVRVVRMVGDEYLQQYFPFRVNGELVSEKRRAEIIAVAEEIDRIWASRQIKRDGYRCAPDPRNVTGIDGVSWRYGRKSSRTHYIDNTFRAVFPNREAGGYGNRNFAVQTYGLRNAFALAGNTRWINTRGYPCPPDLINSALRQFLPYYAEVLHLDLAELEDEVFAGDDLNTGSGSPGFDLPAT